MSETVYIALGANLGDRETTMRNALHQLAQHPQVELRRVSTLIETAAVGGPADSPPYLNAAAEIATTLQPQELLAELMRIERSFGRVRRQRWEPRLLDLDILLFGQQVIATDTLTVPHPLMHTRRFVLQPLAEIAPAIMHPILHATIQQLLNGLELQPPGHPPGA